jgi:hypothetical protein
LRSAWENHSPRLSMLRSLGPRIGYGACLPDAGYDRNIGPVRPGVLRFYSMIHVVNIRATCTAYQPSTKHQTIVAIPPKLSSSATPVLTRLLRSASEEPSAPLERSYACLSA